MLVSWKCHSAIASFEPLTGILRWHFIRQNEGILEHSNKTYLIKIICVKSSASHDFKEKRQNNRKLPKCLFYKQTCLKMGGTNMWKSSTFVKRTHIPSLSIPNYYVASHMRWVESSWRTCNEAGLELLSCPPSCTWIPSKKISNQDPFIISRWISRRWILEQKLIPKVFTIESNRRVEFPEIPKSFRFLSGLTCITFKNTLSIHIEMKISGLTIWYFINRFVCINLLYEIHGSIQFWDISCSLHARDVGLRLFKPII